MSLEDPRNRRTALRNHLVTGQLPGRLLSDRELTVLVVDVSRDGLGVVSAQPMASGDSLWLIIDDRAIELEVRHCRKEVASEGAWRSGLKSVTPSDDLEGVLIDAGLARPSRLLEY